MKKRFSISVSSLVTKLNKLVHVVEEPEYNISYKLSEVISGAVIKAFHKKEVVIDDEWVKIPRKYLEGQLFDVAHELAHIAEGPPPDKKPKSGAPLIQRLIDKVEDSKVVGWFKATLKKAKQEVVELYQDMTQYTVCFLNGIFQAFCPDDDPYRKVSHYYRMLVCPDEPENGIAGIPSRETINRNCKWFREWREAVTYEDPKAKREKHKHRIWERLVRWIKEFLLTLAPQYAAQPFCGVVI